MADYIDRDTVLPLLMAGKSISEYMKDNLPVANENRVAGIDYGIDFCIDTIKDAPSVDITPKTIDICDINGKRIQEGDKVKGLFYFGLPVMAICKYSEKHAAFGLEWHRGKVTEFYPFCCICNVEYEVIDSGVG